MASSSSKPSGVPLKFSAAGLSLNDLRYMLEHSVTAHLAWAIDRIAPRAIIALGRVAAAAASMVFPTSDFAAVFEAGELEAVHGRTFAATLPAIGATYLPSGAGRFFRDRWAREIPEIVTALARPCPETA